jgi:tetratricopeptide (TPR) repeat protein
MAEDPRLPPDYVAQQRGHLARVRASVGDPEGALKEARGAVDSAPESPLALEDLGVVLLISGETADAEAKFRAALAVEPDRPWAAAGVGWCLAKQGRSEEARAQLAAIAGELSDGGDTPDPRLLVLASNAYALVGDANRARELREVVTRRWPNHLLLKLSP